MKNKANVYQYGNTVRFECTFYEFDGEKVNPDLIKITLYDIRRNEIYFESLGMDNQKSLGEYFYDYTTEPKEQKLFYEWYGEINGKPSLKRGEFMTKFI